MPSEELATYSPLAGVKGNRNMLIVNGFNRLAGPEPIDNDSVRGFDMDLDPGIVYQHSPCYCGKQINFEKGSKAIGESGSEYEGLLIAGNTFDYPTRRVRDILSSRTDIAISSCSRMAYETNPSELQDFQLIELIFGAQRKDGYSLTADSCFSSLLCRAISSRQPSTSLLVSGAYIADELRGDNLREFREKELHILSADTYALSDTTNSVQGMNTTIPLYYDLNEKSYATRRASVINPTTDAFCTMLYAANGQSAVTAYQGEFSRTMVFGFPLEMISDDEHRRSIIGATINYLIP